MNTIKDLYSKIPGWIKGVGISAVLIMCILVVVGNVSIKSYIQNHSKEWIGRKVVLGGVRINPLNDSITVHNLRLYEEDSDTVFFSFDRLYVNMSLFSHLINKTVSISEVDLKSPQLRVVMKGSSFNLIDLLSRFKSKEDSVPQAAKGNPVRFVIENISLSQGSLNFHNATFDGALGLESVNFTCPIVAPDKSIIDFILFLGATSGGSLGVNGSFDKNSRSYSLGIDGQPSTLGSYCLSLTRQCMCLRCLDL